MSSADAPMHLHARQVAKATCLCDAQWAAILGMADMAAHRHFIRAAKLLMLIVAAITWQRVLNTTHAAAALLDIHDLTQWGDRIRILAGASFDDG